MFVSITLNAIDGTNNFFACFHLVSCGLIHCIASSLAFPLWMLVTVVVVAFVIVSLAGVVVFHVSVVVFIYV